MFTFLSPHPEEVTEVTVSKDQGASSALWNLLRDAAPRLLRMRSEIDKQTLE
jgi:hypothetical protein